MKSFTFSVIIWFVLQFEPDDDDDVESKSQYEENLIWMSWMVFVGLIRETLFLTKLAAIELVLMSTCWLTYIWVDIMLVSCSTILFDITVRLFSFRIFGKIRLNFKLFIAFLKTKKNIYFFFLDIFFNKQKYKSSQFPTN